MPMNLADVRARRRAAREDAHRRRARRRRARHRGAQPVHRRARRHGAQGDGRRHPRARSRSPAATARRSRATSATGSCMRAAELIRARARRDLRPHHRRVRDLQEGLALRSRPRLRRVHVRRQRRAAGRRPDLFLRPHAARQEAQGLHAARAAARRDLGDHAVQPSAEPGRAQGRAVDRHQQPDGAEAHREDAAVRAAARRHPVRSGPAAARCSRWSPATRARSPTRC